MTFTVPYRRETSMITRTFINDEVHVRYVLDFTDAGKGEDRRAVYQCGLKTREDELESLLITTAIDTGLLFGVDCSKVKCEHGDGVIVVTVEEQVA